MAEPLDPITAAQVIVLAFICPGCGATITVMGRLTLTTERLLDDVVCPACERAYQLRLVPPTDD
jgi:hypothetical protein